MFESYYLPRTVLGPLHVFANHSSKPLTKKGIILPLFYKMRKLRHTKHCREFAHAHTASTGQIWNPIPGSGIPVPMFYTTIILLLL